MESLRKSPGMDARARLIEAAGRIRNLIDVAAAPARRDAVRIASEAGPARERREAARARAAAAAARVRRYGWAPFLGPRARRAGEEAARAAEAADRAWAELRGRAREASEILSAAKAARRSADRAAARARRGDAIPQAIEGACADLLARARFLAESGGSDASRAAGLAPKVFRLAAVAEAIAKAWDGRRVQPRQAVRGAGPVPAVGRGAASFNRPVGPARRGRPSQLALDFDGTGQIEEEPRIWLPVSASRTREMLERGARVDRGAPRRGSQLWIPVSERHRLEPLLPLAFRSQPTRFAFPPIRHNAVGQNLWSVFDRQSWNHIRTTAYDRAGHRCQICGKQGGGLWSRLVGPEERRRGGVVDCHEVWEWEVVDAAAGTGVQRLKRLLVVCKDCHMMFHEGFALHRAREAGIERQAADYIRTLRMLVNRCDAPALEAQLAQDRAAWEANKGVGAWVLDLAHLAQQDFMADHTLVLQDGNRAGLTPAGIGGIAFLTEDGTAFAARDARELARGEPPRPLARAVRMGI